MSSFPYIRKRRGRSTGWVRDLLQEHRLSTKDLIWPLFIQDSKQTHEPIAAMPGVNRLNLDGLMVAAQQAEQWGIPAIALFPVTDARLKDALGKEALNPNNLMCQAIGALKQADINVGIIADVALDPYTTHGHDGLMEQGGIANDATVATLCDMSLVLAEAGVDVIAPSDMMDGRIAAIRETLEENGHTNTLILSYAAKYASAFYGPFRAAVGSDGTLQGASKATYQMDSANSDEAVHEAELDLQEGADILMVKPGMPYLDILYRIKTTLARPTFAYQVSGEYAMLHHYAQSSGQSLERVFTESLIAFKRAGADGILTYAAPMLAKAYQGGHANELL